METNTPATAEWLELNRANWDARVPLHLAGRFYNLPGFLAGDDTLRDFEPGEVGDVQGKTLLHLMCHIGLDTLSWARRGATVTGLDFSQPAMDAAAALAEQIGADAARFVTANVYDAVSAVDAQTFDIVYTSLGSLQFLPDLERWAQTVAALIKPGGFLYVAEFCRFIQFVEDDDVTLRGNYFSREPIVKDERTYGNMGTTLDSSVSVEWIHHPAAVVTALAAAGLRLEFLHEHDWLDYQISPGMVRGEDGHWRFPEPKFPMMFSLRAAKGTAI